MDVNSLRVLNDYLNQTIDALLRGQQRSVIGTVASPIGAVAAPVAFNGTGLSHSPYAAASAFGLTGIDQLTGITHSPFNAYSPFGYGATPFASPLAAVFGGVPTHATANNPFIDPFGVQRGLTHTPYGASHWGVSPLALEMARQQQLTQAIAARQSVLEAMCRSVGIPV
jgi:hypothetical protein